MALKTAIPVSLTGRFSPLGKKAGKGVALWKKYFDSGSKEGVEILIEDDESSEERASSLTGKFCSDKTIDAVFGPYSSGLALAAVKSAAEKEKTLWNHGGASDEICGYPNTVSAITPASCYFHPLLPAFGGKEVVVASVRDSGFSLAVAQGAEKAAVGFGVKIRRFEYKSGSRDFDLLLKMMDENSSGALLSVGRMEDDMALAEKILEIPDRPEFLCFVAAGVEEFGKVFGKKSEGVFSVSQWETNPKPFKPDFGPTSREFSDMFRKEYGHNPDYVAAQSFNIGLVLQKCIEQTGAANDKDLRKAAAELDLTTFYGRFKLDGNGKQTGHKMVVVKWTEEKRVVVEPMGFEPTTSTLPVLRSPN